MYKCIFLWKLKKYINNFCWKYIYVCMYVCIYYSYIQSSEGKYDGNEIKKIFWKQERIKLEGLTWGFRDLFIGLFVSLEVLSKKGDTRCGVVACVELCPLESWFLVPGLFYLPSTPVKNPFHIGITGNLTCGFCVRESVCWCRFTVQR